jgi:hypothetical protein
MQHLSFFLIEYYTLKFEVGYWLWCFTPLSTIFELYRARGSQLYGGGNLSTRRKPPSCRKSLTNFIT